MGSIGLFSLNELLKLLKALADSEANKVFRLRNNKLLVLLMLIFLRWFKHFVCFKPGIVKYQKGSCHHFIYYMGIIFEYSKPLI